METKSKIFVLGVVVGLFAWTTPSLGVTTLTTGSAGVQAIGNWYRFDLNAMSVAEPFHEGTADFSMTGVWGTETVGNAPLLMSYDGSYCGEEDGTFGKGADDLNNLWQRFGLWIGEQVNDPVKGPGGGYQSVIFLTGNRDGEDTVDCRPLLPGVFPANVYSNYDVDGTWVGMVGDGLTPGTTSGLSMGCNERYLNATNGQKVNYRMLWGKKAGNNSTTITTCVKLDGDPTWDIIFRDGDGKYTYNPDIFGVAPYVPPFHPKQHVIDVGGSVWGATGGTVVSDISITNEVVADARCTL